MSDTRFDLSRPPTIASYLVGIFNRLKNYARWSWEWYKLHPYRNTLVLVLLLIIFARGGQPEAAQPITQVEEKSKSRDTASVPALPKESLINSSKAKFADLPYSGFITEKGNQSYVVLVPTEYNDFSYVERLSMQVAIEKSARQNGIVGDIGLMWLDNQGRTHLLSPHALGDRLMDQDGHVHEGTKAKSNKSFNLSEYPSQDEIDEIHKKRFSGDI